MASITLFAQVIRLIPREIIQRLVKKYGERLEIREALATQDEVAPEVLLTHESVVGKLLSRTLEEHLTLEE